MIENPYVNKYSIVSHLPIFATGKIGNDTQCIVTPSPEGQVIHIFDLLGKYCKSSVIAQICMSDCRILYDQFLELFKISIPDFSEATVEIQLFIADDWGIRLEPLSLYFQEVLSIPSNYEDEIVLLAKKEAIRWNREQMCSLIIDETEYWIDRTGQVVAT